MRPGVAAWFTWPVFMAGFMWTSWGCLQAGLDPELWIPGLTVANFVVILALEQLLPRRPEMSTLRDWQSINDSLHGALTGLLRPVGISIGLLLLAALSELRSEPAWRRSGPAARRSSCSSCSPTRS